MVLVRRKDIHLCMARKRATRSTHYRCLKDEGHRGPHASGAHKWPRRPRGPSELVALRRVYTFARIAASQIICMGKKYEDKKSGLCQPCDNRNRLCIALAQVRQARG